jgi:alpha-tubulin suppressor-like RCC1 family protein
MRKLPLLILIIFMLTISAIAQGFSWHGFSMMKKIVQLTILDITESTASMCIRKSNNNIYCGGGNNTYDIQGSGTTSTVSPISTIPNIKFTTSTTSTPKFTSNFSGSSTASSCMLVSNKLNCLGVNTAGIFANGTTTTSGTAVIGGSTTMTEDIQSFTLGGDFGCAITVTNNLYCWGANNYKNINTTGSNILTPILIDSSVTSVSTGYQTTCYIKAGLVYCRGGNNSYQTGYSLGNVDQAGYNLATFTNQVKVLTSQYSNIGDSGNRFTCSLSGTGSVRCWGANNYKQADPTLLSTSNYGLSSTSNIAIPLAASDICIGTQHSCSLQTDGSVYCWGRNDLGQLGRSGDSTNAVGKVTGISTATNLWCTNQGACAKQTDQTTKCWGYIPLLNISGTSTPTSI